MERKSTNLKKLQQYFLKVNNKQFKDFLCQKKLLYSVQIIKVANFKIWICKILKYLMIDRDQPNRGDK